MNEFKYYCLSKNAKQKIIRKLREILQKKKDIIFAVLHGSFIENECFRDIDIAIYVKPSDKKNLLGDYIVSLSLALSQEIGFPVDVQTLNDAPLMFKYEVLRRGELLFCNDELFFERYHIAVEFETWDFNYLLEIIEKI